MELDLSLFRSRPQAEAGVDPGDALLRLERSFFELWCFETPPVSFACPMMNHPS